MQYLFEHLASRHPDPQHEPSKEEMQINVMRQIQCIVASRPWLEGGMDSDGENHLLSFGQAAVPDLSSGNAQQLRHYGEHLKKMIERYEPRLEQAKVTVEPSASPHISGRVTVTGQLQVEDEVLPVLITSELRMD